MKQSLTNNFDAHPPDTHPPDVHAEISIPPLSESLARLMALTSPERQNLRLMELLAMRDPAAVARLLALASSPLHSRKGGLTRVSDALQLLGSESAFSVMFSIWGTSTIACRDDCLKARDFIVSHTFRSCATVRRLANYARYTEIDALDLQLFTLFAKVSMAMALTVDGSQAARGVLQEATTSNRHIFLTMPELDEVFSAAPALAVAWGAPPQVVEALKRLDERHEAGPDCSEWTRLLMLSERLADAEYHPESIEAIQEAQDECCVLIRLATYDVNPMSFVNKRIVTESKHLS